MDQPYGCPHVSEVNLYNTGKLIVWICMLCYMHTKWKHDQTVFIL